MLDIQTLTQFFMWCTIIAGGLYLLTALACLFLPNFIYGLHSKWFKLSRESFNTILYCYIALFKILYIIFIVVPYVALLIIKN